MNARITAFTIHSMCALTAGALLLACGSEADLFADAAAGGGPAASGSGANASSAAGGSATGAGGAPTSCVPGRTESCYSGPSGTEGVGPCTAGARVCAPDGTSFGPCTGEVIPGYDDCGDSIDQDCDGTPAMCTGAHLYSRRFDNAVPYGIAAMPTGGFAVTGQSNGAVDFGAGNVAGQSADVFVARYDASGALVYAKIFGDQGYQPGWDIAADPSGGVTFVGEANGTIDFGGGPVGSGSSPQVFVARLDAGGNHVFGKRFDGTDGHGRAVAVDAAGYSYVAGYVFGSIDFGAGSLPPAGNADAFVVKLDQAGNHVWSKRLGDGETQWATSVAVDASGSVIVAGVFYGTISFGGTTLTSAGQNDAFLAKLSATGAHLWSKRFGEAGNQHIADVAVDATGNITVIGGNSGTIDLGGGPFSAGNTNVFVAAFDASGNHLWSQHEPDAGPEFPWSVAADASGNAIAAGHYTGSMTFGSQMLASTGGNDVFLAKLAPGGAPVWIKSFGDPMQQEGLAVAADGMGRIALGGSFFGTISFGGPALTATNIDGYLAVFSP